MIPAFALGRAQELLLILDEYWKEREDLHRIPVFYASKMATRALRVYQTYINMMNQHVRDQCLETRIDGVVARPRRLDAIDALMASSRDHSRRHGHARIHASREGAAAVSRRRDAVARVHASSRHDRVAGPRPDGRREPVPLRARPELEFCGRSRRHGALCCDGGSWHAPEWCFS